MNPDELTKAIYNLSGSVGDLAIVIFAGCIIIALAIVLSRNRK